MSRAAEKATAPEGEQQRGTADNRWQHHRQDDEGPGHGTPREPGAGEDPRKRDPEHERDPRRSECGGDAQPEGVGDHRPADELTEVRPRCPLQERQKGEGDVGDGDGREGDDQPRCALLPHPPRDRSPAGDGLSNP